jgi:hypothetical protein
MTLLPLIHLTTLEVVGCSTSRLDAINTETSIFITMSRLRFFALIMGHLSPPRPAFHRQGRLFINLPALRHMQSALVNPLPLLLSDAIPLIRNMRVAKQRSNLFQRAALCLGEHKVDDCDVEGARADEHEVEAPANPVEGDGRGDERDFRGEVEGREAEGGAGGAEVVGEDLGDVDVLRCVDEEAPPEDVEEADENGGFEAGAVGCVEEGCGESAEEDGGGQASACADEQHGAAADFVNVKGSPCVSNTMFLSVQIFYM